MLLDLLTILASGLMVGNEFAVAAFIHPTLERLPDAVHLSSSVALARILGRVMPFWYGLVLLLMVADALLRHHAAKQWPWGILIAAILWTITILYTLAALVPINNQVSLWTESAHPPDWKSFRHRWDVLHRWRVALLTLSLTLFVSFALLHPVL